MGRSKRDTFNNYLFFGELLCCDRVCLTSISRIRVYGRIVKPAKPNPSCKVSEVIISNMHAIDTRAVNSSNVNETTLFSQVLPTFRVFEYIGIRNLQAIMDQ